MSNNEIKCAYWGIYKDDEPFEFGVKVPKKIVKGDIVIISHPKKGIVDKNMDIYNVSFANKPLPNYTFPDEGSIKVNGNMLNKMFDIRDIKNADNKEDAKRLFQ